MSAEKFDESKSEKELDHTDTYRGVKWEAWYDAKTKKYDVWLYLKAGKTLVAKDVDPSPYNIKMVAWDKIDKTPASKKPVKKLAESLLDLVESKTTVKVVMFRLKDENKKTYDVKVAVKDKTGQKSTIEATVDGNLLYKLRSGVVDKDVAAFISRHMVDE